MSSFFVTGKQGNGKSLIAVGRIFNYLLRGNMVATNLDLYLDKYLHPSSRRSVIRLPDKPSVEDFKMLGSANSTYDEEKNGLLVLDELGAWFNTRAWQDKGRKEVLEHFIYLRKLGWDILLLVQDIDMVDGQLRGMLGEHLVICRRLDRIKIPVLGNFIRFFGGKGVLPKVHRAKVYFGETAQDLHVDTWTYSGKQFYAAYDTKQIFSAAYPHGVHSVLSPWHTKGRYLSPKLSVGAALRQWWSEYQYPRPVASVPLKNKLPQIAQIMQFPPDERMAMFRYLEKCQRA